MATKKFSEFDPAGNIIQIVGLFDNAGVITNGITGPMRVITQAEYDVLNAKAPTANATFTGVTKVAQPGTDIDEVATIKFVSDSVDASVAAITIPIASVTVPLMDAVAEVGVSVDYARADHIHPSDTTKASLSGATFTGPVTFAGTATFAGTVKAPQPVGDADDVATVEFVNKEVNKEIVISTTTDATMVTNKLNVINIPALPSNAIIPAASGFLTGTPIIVLNISATDPVTITPTGADTIIPAVASIVTGESKTFYSDGVSKWYAV